MPRPKMIYHGNTVPRAVTGVTVPDVVKGGVPLPRPHGTKAVLPITGPSKLICIGIDPGSSGGIAVIDTDGVFLHKMPDTERDIWDFIRQYDRPHRDVVALIEKVGGFMGRKGGEDEQRNRASGHTMFTFGMGYGLLRMALIAAYIPFEEVLPKTWQKEFSIQGRKKAEPKSVLKRRCKEKAQQLFPRERIINDTADALLIAEYCRRKHCMPEGASRLEE
jgi:hypothetical protein